MSVEADSHLLSLGLSSAIAKGTIYVTGVYGKDKPPLSLDSNRSCYNQMDALAALLQ